MLLVGDGKPYWGTEILLHVDHNQRRLVIFCGHVFRVLCKINIQSKLSKIVALECRRRASRSADAIRSITDKISSYLFSLRKRFNIKMLPYRIHNKLFNSREALSTDRMYAINMLLG